MSYCPNCGSKVSTQDNFCSNCGNLLSLKQRSRFSYAGFWRRLLAILIDGTILSGIWAIISRIFDIPLPGYNLSLYEFEYAIASGYETINVTWELISAMLSWLYYASFECSKYRATPGKMALGIVVTDYDGEQISFGKATGRYFAKMISAIILFIGFIMAAFTDQKQALHDIMAGTLVVKKGRQE